MRATSSWATISLCYSPPQCDGRVKTERILNAIFLQRYRFSKVIPGEAPQLPLFQVDWLSWATNFAAVSPVKPWLVSTHSRFLTLTLRDVAAVGQVVSAFMHLVAI